MAKLSVSTFKALTVSGDNCYKEMTFNFGEDKEFKFLLKTKPSYLDFCAIRSKLMSEQNLQDYDYIYQDLLFDFLVLSYFTNFTLPQKRNPETDELEYDDLTCATIARQSGLMDMIYLELEQIPFYVEQVENIYKHIDDRINKSGFDQLMEAVVDKINDNKVQEMMQYLDDLMQNPEKVEQLKSLMGFDGQIKNKIQNG